MLLFVRETKINHATGETEAYTFLGSAEYVSHQGSRPMSILWKLKEKIPAKDLRKVQQVMG